MTNRSQVRQTSILCTNRGCGRREVQRTPVSSSARHTAPEATRVDHIAPSHYHRSLIMEADMPRRGGSCAGKGRKGAEACAAAFVLFLSAGRPSHGFAPFPLIGGSGTSGLKRRAGAGVGGGIVVAKRGTTMVAGIAAEEAAVDTTSTAEVVNNNMKPFIAVPRRDPQEWFDGLRAQAGPRRAELTELSRAGEEQLASIGLPTRKQEPYRYTDLESLYRTDFVSAPLVPSDAKTAAQDVSKYLIEETQGQQLVFVNGAFSAELSDMSNLEGVEGLVAGNVGGLEGDQLKEAKDILAYLPETDADHRTTQGSLPFCSLNQACFTDAAVIMLGDGVRVEKPIQLLFFSDGVEDASVSYPRVVVKAGADSHLSFTQGYVSRGGVCFANGLTRILVGDRANVEHDYLEEMAIDDRFVDTVSVMQTVNSTYSVNQVIAGGFDARANLQIDLMETGSHCNVYTAALTTGKQRQDVHTTIQHKAEGTSCLQEQRNIVTDKADCVFKGRIVIDAIAQLTAAQQLCRTLLVSDRARVTVMPSMEIIANDVTCTHGATITDLEDEELFYLMTRGINKLMAKSLVIKSFADIVILRFLDKSLRERVTAKLMEAAPREDRAAKSVWRSI